jgi:hypothetical protein
MKYFSIRKLIITLHRDIGYFFSSLIIIYCISGLALNHVDDWNPDFIIHKEKVSLNKKYVKEDLTKESILEIASLVKEHDYKVFDFPTDEQLKIYFDNATLHINLADGYGTYEKIVRRPIFYESNVIHRNSLKGWKWVSDIFAVMLIIVNCTGLMILKGKNGFSGRGKWFVAAGTLLPICGIIVFEMFQK